MKITSGMSSAEKRAVSDLVEVVGEGQVRASNTRVMAPGSGSLVFYFPLYQCILDFHRERVLMAKESRLICLGNTQEMA